jgi:hypothetical protein
LSRLATKKRTAQGLKLRARIESGELAQTPDEKPLAVGRGVLEELVPQLGPMQTPCVFVFTDQAVYYEYLEETPKELLKPRALALGLGPSSWKEVARSSTTTVRFWDVGETDARRTIDGHWDLLLMPESVTGESDYRSLRVMECYEGPLDPDLIAEMIRLLPERKEQALRSEEMFAGTRPDATEEEVKDAAEQGQLHPRTNLDVVLELVFRPLLEPGESTVFFRPGQVSAAAEPLGGRRLPDHQSGWILVTSESILWYLVNEGPEGGIATASSFPGVPRRISFDEVTQLEIDTHPASPTLGDGRNRDDGD